MLFSYFCFWNVNLLLRNYYLYVDSILQWVLFIVVLKVSIRNQK